jgi:chromosome segregation ATPase
LEIAYDEISELGQTVLALQEAVAQYKVGAAAAEDKIRLLESEKAVLQAQLDSAFEESTRLADRLLAAEAATQRSEENVATSIKQIEFLNSELMASSAERFRIVAAMQGDQRRQRGAFNQQKSILEYRLQEKEALAATQSAQIKQLEGLRDELHKRSRVIEALITSEREAAERKIKGLAQGFGAAKT